MKAKFFAILFLSSVYWNKPHAEWGSIVDWDMFYIDQMPGSTPHDAHLAISRDLDTLLSILPTKSREYQKASSLRVLLNVSALFFFFFS